MTLGANSRRFYILMIAAAIGVVAAILWWVWPKPTHVKIYRVRAQTLQNRVFASGVVRPVHRQVILASELTAPFEGFRVKVGDAVKKGTVLLNTSENSTNQIITGASLASYLQARFAGVVLDENPDGLDPDGNTAPLLELVSPARTVLVDLSEEDAVHVHSGMNATITAAAYANRTWRAKVDSVANYAAPTSSGGANEVQVAIHPVDLFQVPYGYQVNVTLVLSSRPHATVVPYSALVQSGSVYQVFVVGQGNRVQSRTVTVGTTGNTLVEVTTGLKVGERIVDNPPSGLANGQVVAVK